MEPTNLQKLRPHWSTQKTNFLQRSLPGKTMIFSTSMLVYPGLFVLFFGDLLPSCSVSSTCLDNLVPLPLMKTSQGNIWPWFKLNMLEPVWTTVVVFQSTCLVVGSFNHIKTYQISKADNRWSLKFIKLFFWGGYPIPITWFINIHSTFCKTKASQNPWTSIKIIHQDLSNSP
jgi:hypothetical protein